MELSFADTDKLIGVYRTLSFDSAKLKIEAIDTLARAAHKFETLDFKEEIEALVEAVMFDLGLAWDHEDKMYEYVAKEGTLSERMERAVKTFKELNE